MNALPPIVLLAAIGSTSLVAAAPAQQTLPSVWNRSQDWVPQQNPSPDSKGNLVWYHGHKRGSGSGTSQTWSAAWGGWVYGHSSAYYDGAAPITKDSMVHMSLYDLWRRYHVIIPDAQFRNTTGESFLLSIEGRLSFYWTGANGVAANVPVIVEIWHHDVSQPKNTLLLSSELAKPTATTTPEYKSLAVNIPVIRVDPGDMVRILFWCKNATATHAWVAMTDRNLNLVRKSLALATETPRYASPKNPLTLREGRTSRPLIGHTWDPYLADSPANAQTDVLAIGVTKIHAGTPFGTLLTDLLVTVAATPRASFSVPIPNDPTLAGVELATQGASITATPDVLLANALDIRIGDF